MTFPTINLKGVVVLILVLGAGLLLLLLGSGVIPAENRDFFNFALGAWVSWAGMAVKRVLDGSDSGDTKNDTIAAQAQALAKTGGGT